jgi:hypothetical protein
MTEIPLQTRVGEFADRLEYEWDRMHAFAHRDRSWQGAVCRDVAHHVLAAVDGLREAIEENAND